MGEKQIRIAVVGTHGVGKTGLVHALAGACIARSYPTDAILEVARELARLKPNEIKLNEESTLEAQVKILEYQFKREEEARNYGYRVVVCDRAFDNYLYMERKFGPQKLHKKLVLDHINNNPYDLVVKVPLLSGPIVHDGVRSLDIEFQADIDARINKFLEENKIAHLVLPEPVMPFREDWTYRVLNNLSGSLVIR